MATLENLVIKLVGDGSSYQRMIRDSVSNTRKLDSSFKDSSRQAIASGNDYQKFASLASNGMGQVASKVGNLGNVFKKAGKMANDQLTSMGNKISNLTQKTTQLGISITKHVFSAFLSLGKASISASAGAETLAMRMEILAGSAEKGQAAFKKISEFAAGTPFRLPELVEANNLLLGFGMSVEEAYGTLEVLSNTSAATGAEVGRLARIFGQAKGTGKVMTEDLNQLVDAGVPIYEVLGDLTQKTASDLRKMASEGKISFEMLSQAFVDTGKKGGRFEGALAKMANTTEGRWSTFQDKIGSILIKIGDIVATTLDPLVSKLFELINSIDVNDDKWTSWGVTIGAITAALGPILAVVGPLIGKIGALTIGFAKFIVAIVSSLGNIWALGAAIAFIELGLLALTGSFEDTGTIIGNVLDRAVEYGITGMRILQRIFVLGAWTIASAFVKALRNGLIQKLLSFFGYLAKTVSKMLSDLNVWLLEKAKALVLGTESRSISDLLAQVEGDIGAGIEAGQADDPLAAFASGAANIIKEEMDLLNERTKGKDIIPAEIQGKIAERLAKGQEKAGNLLDKINQGISKLNTTVEKQSEKATDFVKVMDLGLN